MNIRIFIFYAVLGAVVGAIAYVLFPDSYSFVSFLVSLPIGAYGGHKAVAVHQAKRASDQQE